MTSIAPLGRNDIERSILDRLAAIVSANGDRIAVAGETESHTYRDLDCHSNALACRILENDNGGSAPVALLFNQGPAFVIAALAVLKAGRIFVPLDPRDPQLAAAALTASGAALMLHDPANQEIAASLPAAGLLPFSPPYPVSEELPHPAGNAAEFCYIYFTTGSTGAPKGVLDTQRNVLHNAYRYTVSLAIKSEDRLSMIQSPSFSGCMSSLFTALLNGATLCPFDLRGNGIARLAHWIGQERITVFHAVPLIFRGLARPGRLYPSVRAIRLEGDRATRSCIDVYRDHFSPECRIVVGLGATECGLVCRFEVDRVNAATLDQPPLGYACPDIRLRLVDEHGEELPAGAIGAIGEITVESEFLAHGYWQQPGLTADAFESLDAHSRLRRYRTGDLGYMDTDGCLHYVSRKASRLRLNGETVDPARIESAVTATGLSEQCIATQHNDETGRARLAVYYVMNTDGPIEPLAFNRRLRGTLPFRFLPRWYVPLTALPVSADGKVATGKLPAPEHTHRVIVPAGRPPAGELERAIVRLWEPVLGFELRDVDQNVFELGIDSLTAEQLLLEVTEHYGLDMTIDRIYDNPSAAGMAGAVEALRGRARPIPATRPDNTRRQRLAASSVMRARRRPGE